MDRTAAQRTDFRVGISNHRGLVLPHSLGPPRAQESGLGEGMVTLPSFPLRLISWERFLEQLSRCTFFSMLYLLSPQLRQHW